VPSPVSLALLGVAIGLVGNLATNLVEVRGTWWRPAVFVTLVVLVAGVVALETVRQRAERAGAQPAPGEPHSRVFGAVPRQAWQWQPRPQEEAQLRAALGRRGSAALVALPGARGAGKSQLAAGYARWCLDQGFDLVAWINAEPGPVAELAALAGHLGLPGVAELEPPQAAAAVCRWLERDGRARRLLVYDNVDDPDALRGYVPVAGSAKVLITTNRREFGTMAGTAVVEVGMFTPDEGAAFLSRATGLDPDGAGVRLGEQLGWLPLGLAQAAAFIRRTGVSYAEYIGLLQRQDLDETLRQQAGADHPGVLRATRLSVAGLAETDRSGDAARLLRVLSLLSPDGVSRDLLVQAEQQLRLAGGVWPSVNTLVEASLVTLGGDASPAPARDDRRVVAVHRLTALVIRHEAGKPPGEDRGAALDTATRLLDTLTDHFLLEQVALRRDELDELAAHLDAVLGHADDPSPLLLVQANWIAQLLARAGDLTRAVPLLERTLTDRVRVLGAEDPDTLNSRNNLAGAYESVGRVGEAIVLHEGVLADRERVLGAEHPNTLTSRNNLAFSYESVGRVDEAIALYEGIVAASERTLGAEHSDTLISRGNLAGAYESAGRLDEAIALHRRTLADRERVLGADHPDTLSSRNNLAMAYTSVERLDEAIVLLELTLADRERVLGADHPNTMTSRSNLAYAYDSAGRLDEAIALQERTLADRQRVLGAQHPDTHTSRNNLAYAYTSVGRTGEAIVLLELTLADRERMLGVDHPDTMTSRSNLAYAYDSAGRLDEAIDLYEQHLTTCVRVLGPNHPGTEGVRSDLAGARRERAARERPPADEGDG
jgi:tetratricopeptide (TPR) repeat protein